MKAFEMTHLIFRSTETFTEETAPSWLCKGGLEGSTMCNRWFWNEHILTLKSGESVDTDFRQITRIK